MNCIHAKRRVFISSENFANEGNWKFTVITSAVNALLYLDSQQVIIALPYQYVLFKLSTTIRLATYKTH